MSRGKRVLDCVVASVGLLLLLPLFLIIALLIRLDGGGPVFFRQERVGYLGRPFGMWKFRSMIPGAERSGELLTVGRDRRVTRIGAWLRSMKLDELPQLFNVLRGDMSLVGPRPEVAKYVELWSPAERRVLDLVPGITDPASIVYRRESELLAQAANPEATYTQEIMPDKIRLNLEYARKATLASDMLVVLRTVLSVGR
jgi:lipopolysaccharide/colanic/teichoic acid biosynthesis glycosyltransferase